MYTRDKKMRVQDSCRGGWLLSTVSVLILGDFKDASCESEQQWHRQQEWEVHSKSAHAVTLGFYSVGHRFESQSGHRLRSLRIFMDFSHFLQRKSEVVFTLKTMELDISYACRLFVLNYNMFRQRGRHQEDLINTHRLLPEALHIWVHHSNNIQINLLS
jgi:hypothetical protein